MRRFRPGRPRVSVVTGDLGGRLLRWERPQSPAFSSSALHRNRDPHSCCFQDSCGSQVATAQSDPDVGALPDLYATRRPRSSRRWPMASGVMPSMQAMTRTSIVRMVIMRPLKS